MLFLKVFPILAYLLIFLITCSATKIDIEGKELQLVSVLIENCKYIPIDWPLLQESLTETNEKIIETKLAAILFDNILDEKINYLKSNNFSCKEEIEKLSMSLEELSTFSNRKYIKEAIKTSRKFPNKRFRNIKQFKEELSSFLEEQVPHSHLHRVFNHANVLTTLIAGVLSICNLGLPVCTVNATVAVLFWSLWYRDVHDTLLGPE